MLNMQKKTLIMHLKKHLVMSKDYYTKAEVDKLLANQKEEILGEISKVTKLKGFELSSEHGMRMERFKEINSLRDYLLINSLIEFVDLDLFLRVFNGKELQNASNSKPLVKWIGQKNLCPYLLDQLNEYYFLERDNIDKKANYIFGIKNAAQLRIKYKSNIKELPSNYQIIDKIINILVMQRKLLLEDQIYFEKEILPYIENDYEDLPPEYYDTLPPLPFD